MNTTSLELLEKIKHLMLANKPIETTDVICYHLDTLFSDGNFQEAASFLDVFETDKFPTRVLTGMLTLSWWAKEYLGPSYLNFKVKVKGTLKNTHKLTEDQVSEIMDRVA